jgi:hypothetical protein
MRLAGHAGEETRVAGGDLDVEPGLGDQDPDLVQGPDDGEGHERADEGHQPGRRQARGHAEHVLLGDAHLQVALRMALLEHVGLRRAAHVGVEHHDPGIRVGELGYGLAEDFAHRAADRECHRAPPSVVATGSPSSAIAVANSSAVIGRVCQ